MIAARASGAFICFRCELHVARPPLAVLSRRPHAAFSTSVRRRDEVDTNDADAFPDQRPQLNKYPLGRILNRKGKRVRATTARLGEGVKTLGDDAEIIVLRDVGRDPVPEDEPQPAAASTTPAKGPNLRISLQNDSKPATDEEIAKQIDNLRPKTDDEIGGPQYVHQNVFAQIYRKLGKGFTSKQLSYYYSITKGVEEQQVQSEVLDGLKRMQSRPEQPLERSAWHPGITHISHRLPSLHSVHDSRGKRSSIGKAVVIDQIMRGIWKLVLLEEIEAPGEMELRAEPWQLHLLQSGVSPTPLDRVGIIRKAKIEIDASSSVIRITADKTTAEYAADDIEQLLKGIHSTRLDLKKWIPYLSDYDESKGMRAYLPDNVLHNISAMTQASVLPVTGDTISIQALSQKATSEAERSVLKMLPIEAPVAQSSDTTRRDAAGDRCFLTPAYIEDSAMGFRWRGRNLGRWTVPQERHEPRNRTSPNDESYQGVDEVKTHLLSLMDRVLPSSNESSFHKFPGGFSAPEVQMEAQFGHVLFSGDGSQIKTQPGYGPPPFHKTVPGLLKLLKDIDLVSTTRVVYPRLTYSFVAEPDQPGFKKGQLFPTLQITFRIIRPIGGYFRLRKVQLSYNSTVHDILLPEQAVDIRYHLQTAVQIKMQTLKFSEDPLVLKLKAFAEGILEPLQHGMDATPPNQTLEIPVWAIPGHESQKDTETVKYMFSGVKFAQTISAKYSSTYVGITTENSGKLGSKGTQMTAYYDDKTVEAQQNLVPITNDSQMTDFIQQTFTLASRITDAARNTTLGSQSLHKSIASSSDPTMRISADEDRTNQSLRNVEKRRDPNSARAINRRDRFGNPAYVVRRLHPNNFTSLPSDERSEDLQAKDHDPYSILLNDKDAKRDEKGSTNGSA
ncbi:unnamed protein product [Periconia digitata]|uniref:Uncharacterized protein n=1 Tax=Periconia digitata TaxID=1303443 RepID=A0A9W4UBC3_9PLEO|nr:unnamed protein product [Periconia digitata]